MTGLLAAFLALVGAFSAVFLLPVQQEPPVKIPVITVTVPYPGASPWEVQSEVVRELEEKLKGLENVDHIYSTAGEGFALTTVEFHDRVDVELAKREVRDRLDQAKAEFPAETEEPLVADVDFEDLPVLFLTLTEPGAGAERTRERILADLNRIAEDVEDRLLLIPGISTVDRYGELEREVRLRLDPKRAAAHGLSFAEVARAVASQNLALPGGTLDLAESTLAVRLSGKYSMPEELGSVVVARRGDGLVHLDQLIVAIETVKKAASYARMGGHPAVTLVLHAKSGQNIVGLVGQVKTRIAELRAEGLLPAGIEATYTKDQSFWIWLMIQQLGSSALFGGVLVVVVLYFGMGLRSGFIIAAAIPFSVLFCCLCQAVFGLSINNMTLFSLILILGMVVDGAIVVGENIYRHLEMGKRPRQAVLDGVHEVGLAVISADLTTIAAFLPMMFMTGVMGSWMELMPMIVAFTLGGSILADHFFLPVLARRTMRVRPALDAPRGAGPFAFLARHRALAFLACLAPAVLLGPLLLGLLERLAAALLSYQPEWSRAAPTRWLAAGLTGVFLDYLLQRLLAARFGVRTRPESEDEVLAHLAEKGGLPTRLYQEILRFSLDHPPLTILVAALGLACALMLPLSGRLATAFFGKSDTGWYYIKFELPPGSSLEASYEFAGRLERVLGECLLPYSCAACGWRGGLRMESDECPACGGRLRGELKSTVTTLGESSAYMAFQGEIGASGPEFGQIEVELRPREDRIPVKRKVKRRETFGKSPLAAWVQGLLSDPEELIEVVVPRTMFEIVEAQKEWVRGRFPGVKVDFSLMAEGPPVGAPITARVRGRDLETIAESADAVEAICLAAAECRNVQNSNFRGRREVRVVPDRDRAARFGLTPEDLARALFTAFQGWEVARMTLEDEEVEIRLENADLARRSLEDVRDLELPAAGGGTVPLREVARVEVGATVSSLRRHDRRQSITITAEIAEEADEEAVKGRVMDAVAALALPREVTVEFGGQEEEQQESMASLFRAFIIAVVLIFFILTAQFGSFKQPVAVILTIPLSIVGALTGLYASGNQLDFMAMVGIVCLAGIVVNDAIVLVDFTNQLRRRGASVREAALLAGKARLRPILMTTITTVVGLLPLTLNLTGGGDFWASMGFAIICGLLVATLLTLVVIPTFYTLVERDAWEPSPLGRIRRALGLARERGRLRRLSQGGRAGLAAAELRRSLLQEARDRLRSAPVEELQALARLCRNLSGCPWRVDPRLGEHQRELTLAELDRWLLRTGSKSEAAENRAKR